jgi:signal transduction histidine kinase
LGKREQIIEQIAKLERELYALDNISGKTKFAFPESFNHSLLLALPDMVFVLDDQGIFIDYYSGNDTQLYVSPGKIIGSNLSDLMPDYLVKLTMDNLRSVLRTGEIQTYRYSLKQGDNTDFYESRMVLFKNDQVVALVKCITDTVSAENKAIIQRDYLLGIMNNSPVGILQVNKHGSPIFVNAEFLRLFNKQSLDKEFGFDDYKSLFNYQFITVDDLFFAVQNTGGDNLQLNVNLEVENQEKHFRVSAHFSRNPMTYEPELFFYVTDLTEQHNINQELKHSLDKLETAQTLGKIGYWEYHISSREVEFLSEPFPEFDVFENRRRYHVEELLNIVYPVDLPILRSLMLNLKENGPSYICEQIRVLFKDEIYWFELRTSRNSLDILESRSFITGSIQNITDLKKQEELLLDNQKFQDLLLDNLPVAVYLRDINTLQYRLWNKSAERLFEMPKQKILHKNGFSCSEYEFACILNRLDEEIYAGSDVSEILEEKCRVGKKVKYISSYHVPVHFQGKRDAILGISIDVTEKVIVETELYKAKEQAEQNAKLKLAFLANMSHEIRNPMNAIVGFSKILVEDDTLSNQNKQEFVELIGSNANQLLSLISDIIDIAKIEANKLVINHEDTQINILMTQLYSTFRLQMNQSGKQNVKLIQHIGLSDEQAYVNTDGQRLVQVISNLLSNAIRFTSSGKIEFGYSLKSDSELLFFVKDTGAGIPEKELKNIFSEFHQVGNNFTGKEGKGLGLTISEELVKCLGGKIWVESKLNHGAEFYFTLPYVCEKQNIDLAKQTKIINTNYDWSNRRILIVDDNPDVLSFIQILLRSTNIHFMTAENGADAVDIVMNSAQNIDAVLMDIQMPIMNGVNALRSIKQTYPKIPIVAQTAYALAGEKQKFLDEGFDYYIIKPIKKADLFSILHEIFDR